MDGSAYNQHREDDQLLVGKLAMIAAGCVAVNSGR
jgi:hypothetical protein